MNIKHDPLFNIAATEKHFSEQDGVPVKYVCTTELQCSDVPMDIYYRATPHPKFGNHYFALYFDYTKDSTMITDADVIEGVNIAMVDVDGTWHYSQRQHDYQEYTDSEGNLKVIDGGRAYARGQGFEFFKIEKGDIVPM